MKSLFITILVLTFCAAAARAQTNEISPCPTVDVTSPAEIVLSGETATFTGNLSEKARKYNLQYQWTASGGEIIEGQGTLSVKVFQKSEKAGDNFTLTLEVIGLPPECSNRASETAFIAPLCPIELEHTDEFSIYTSRINKARLDAFLLRLKNTPSGMGYIIESFAKKTSRNLINQKNQKIFSYLKFRGFKKDQIVLLNAFAYENLTQFIFVPAGATPPDCDDCIKIENP